MEHVEAREILEVAAVEPGGLDRLVAGDTPQAAALAAHLAGCAECTAEVDRLRRASTLIRGVVAAAPSPELRERTLAYVAAVGRPRGAGSVASIGPSPAAPPAPTPIDRARPAAGSAPATVAAGPGQRRLGLWAASLAAAVVVAVAGTSFLVGTGRDELIAQQGTQIAALSKVTAWTLRIDREPDARQVELAGPSTATTGRLSYSPATTELVVVAEGLPAAPAGMEYRCWIEVDGARQAIGRMFFAGDVAFWVGEASSVAGRDGDATFGVSLAPAGTEVPTTDPVIGGAL